MKIAFFGTPRLAQIVLEKLISSHFKPELIVTSPDAKVGRGRTVKPSPVKKTALEHGIKILQPDKLIGSSRFTVHPSASLWASSSPFDLAILVAYGKIIPKEVLEIPRLGFVNVHPSLLPNYRGPSPIQTALLNGEEKTGVSLMVLDEELDHGPVLAQKEIALESTDTHGSLIEKMGEIGAEFLIETLPGYINGSLKPTPQDHTKTTLTKKITKADGKIDINNPPDHQILDRMIRAFYPWPTVWATVNHNGKDMLLKFLPTTNYELQTTNYLIQPEGKRPMTIKEFLNGYPTLKESISKILTT